MGTLGPVLAAHPTLDVRVDMMTPSTVPSTAHHDAVLQGYRACLREALRTLVEHDNTPTTDPRVLAVTSHLCRRQAALELDEELRRRHHHLQHQHLHHQQQLQQQHLRRQLLDHYFRGVDLHYMASPSTR